MLLINLTAAWSSNEIIAFSLRCFFAPREATTQVKTQYRGRGFLTRKILLVPPVRQRPRYRGRRRSPASGCVASQRRDSRLTPPARTQAYGFCPAMRPTCRCAGTSMTARQTSMSRVVGRSAARLRRGTALAFLRAKRRSRMNRTPPLLLSAARRQPGGQTTPHRHPECRPRVCRTGPDARPRPCGRLPAGGTAR